MPEPVTRLWELVTQSTGQLTTGELIVRTALICCSLFATVQLLSMLATHYGDNNATSKSFFLSLLLHCCFGLGWASVVDRLPTSTPPGEIRKPSVRITLRDEDDSAPDSGSSSRPLWTSPQQLEVQLTRLQRPELDTDLVETPAAESAPRPEPMPPETPDLPSRIETLESPTRQDVASTTTPSPAPQAVQVDQPVAESRAEVKTVAVSRQKLDRETASLQLLPQPATQRGAAERMAPLVEDGRVLTLPSDVVPEAAIPKPVGAPDALIRRRTSPNPVAAEVAEPGDSPTASPNATSERKVGKFSRAGSRSGTDFDFEPKPATRPGPVASRVGSPPQAPPTSLGTEIPGPAPSPELARIDSAPVAARPPTRDPETYRSRRIEQRNSIALKNGGSEASERAVEASLRWMASIQESAGNWSASRYGGGAAKRDPQGQIRLDGGLYADSGITGLVVLSYLGAGYTHEDGKYAGVVMRAIKWLIAQQAPNGYLGGRATRYDMMYCHAMATFALAEAYGMQADPGQFAELREAVRGGVRLICTMQNDDGGWRYGKGGESDMSMFGWQLMALKSAVNAGIPIPEENRRGMTKFLQARALGPRGGLAGYKANEAPSPSMTAEALFCRQMFGVRPEDAASQEAVAYLRRHLPRLSAYDEYYWYYGTLAMFQHDGEPWDEWNGALRDMLVGLQRTQGPLAGSWDPNGKWAGIGGRLYSTAVSTMCLEVYYRFLRIYQSQE